MTIAYNTDHLQRYFAPGISGLASCNAPDLTGQHSQAPHWLQNLNLNSVFRGAFKDRYRQYALNQLYRAQVAFSDYHEARTLTLHFLRDGRPDNPAVRAYFKAVSRWESCLLNLQMFVDVMNKVKKEFNDEKVFNAGDGSIEERAYELANTVKHWGSHLAADRHSEHHTIPVWLTNDGLQSYQHRIKYGELAEVVAATARVADDLQDPYRFTHPGGA